MLRISARDMKENLQEDMEDKRPRSCCCCCCRSANSSIEVVQDGEQEQLPKTVDERAIQESEEGPETTDEQTKRVRALKDKVKLLVAVTKTTRARKLPEIPAGTKLPEATADVSSTQRLIDEFAQEANISEIDENIFGLADGSLGDSRRTENAVVANNLQPW